MCACVLWVCCVFVDVWLPVSYAAKEGIFIYRPSIYVLTEETFGVALLMGGGNNVSSNVHTSVALFTGRQYTAVQYNSLSHVNVTTV